MAIPILDAIPAHNASIAAYVQYCTKSDGITCRTYHAITFRISSGVRNAAACANTCKCQRTGKCGSRGRIASSATNSEYYAGGRSGRIASSASTTKHYLGRVDGCRGHWVSSATCNDAPTRNRSR